VPPAEPLVVVVVVVVVVAMSNRAHPYKVVVFGAGAVGKSSITLRFVSDTFSDEYLPTIEDCYRKNCLVDDQTAFLDILDTAGQEEYEALRDQWVREGRAFLLVYSIVSRSSFEDVASFRDRILQVQERDGVPMVLVGNKCDLETERDVSQDEAIALSREYGVPFIECSALTGHNCTEVFAEAVREIRREEQRSKQRPKDNKPAKKRFWCSVL
jgi:GTPase KRas protein